MARFSNVTVENNFTKGLITEFSALNFPENAVTEGDNCIYDELGIVSRRLGVDYENNYQTHALSGITSNTGAFVEFEWTSVGNEGTTTFVVQQIGDTLVFFESGNDAVSSNKKSFEVDLGSFKVSGVSTSTLKDKRCQFASGKGYLFVVNPVCEPFVVQYDSDTDTITSTEVQIQIRDFEGVDDGLEIDERPTTLSNTHHYNLLNQGWGASAQPDNQENFAIVKVLNYWSNSLGNYPSNADTWWYYMRVATEGSVVGLETFSPSTAITRGSFLGNTPAPKGHLIYNAFNIDRSTETGVTGLTTTSSGTSRPSTISFFTGRVFYAGVDADGYSNSVYFTQVVEGEKEFGKCYQKNDPTSKDFSDLLDTDGGVIILPQIERIVALKIIGEVLLVIGTNGVFAIRGSDNGPFRATNYSADYISPIGATSPLSIVEVNNGVLWWNYDALYSLERDQTGFSFIVNNISNQTIQSVVDNVPQANKDFIKGVFNKRQEIVRWVFSDDEDLSDYNYNRILDFNLISKAFYTHTVDTTLAPRVSGLLSISGEGLTTTDEDVETNGGDTVVDSGGNTVTVETNSFLPKNELFKFLVTGNISSSNPGLTYGELNNVNYKDWEEFDNTGVSYTSYGVTGYRLKGELMRSFNSSTIVFVMAQETGSQCIIQGVWDYGLRTTSGQQIYQDNPNLDYVIRKVKLRGKGQSFQLKFSSFEDNPFNLVGWGTFETGGSAP